MKLLLAGSTGLVGRHVLDLALGDPRIEAVAAPVRRPLAPHPKLLAPVVDFERLPEDAPWWRADAAVCAIGTTLRKAGSKEGFRGVDFDYALGIARLARRHGARSFALNSALGADPASAFFYNRVKGELERALAGLGFPSLTFVRPGLIGGDREEVRPAERLAATVLGALHPILPKRLRINPAPAIARALLDAALTARPGVRVIGSGELAG